MKKIILSVSGVLLVFALALVISVLRQPAQTAQGSVGISNEYHSTTTPFLVNSATTTRAAGGNFLVSLNIASTTRYGSLGSVIFTGANTADLVIYDATTTDRNKKGPNDKATTTLVAFPPNMAAGTYTFDIIFTRGLLVEIGVAQGTSSQPTTTITWR